MSSSQRELGGRSKYELISKANATPRDEQERTARSYEYAEFLKNLERTCGPIGFVDSSHFQYKYRMHDSGDKTRSHSADRILELPSLIDVSKDQERYEQMQHKRMKRIQNSMVIAKQKERELKRMEGDIFKSQQDLRQSVRQFEKDISQRRFGEEKKLAMSRAKYDIYQKEYDIEKVLDIRQRVKEIKSANDYEKSQDRKAQMTLIQLTNQYQTKIAEINMRHHERNRLAREYEEKIRRKEQEELRLNRELEEILLSMQMESMKHKTQNVSNENRRRTTTQRNIDEDRFKEQKLDQKLGQSGEDFKKADSINKVLSSQLRNKQSISDIQKRDQQRAIESTRLKLAQSSQIQRQLIEATAETEREKQRNQMELKLKESEARRTKQASHQNFVRKKTKADRESFYLQKAEHKLLEEKRSGHEDHLRHFERIVKQGESIDQSLYSQLKRVEQEEQLTEQALRQLTQQLQISEQENSRLVNKKLSQANHQEIALREKLNKTTADLNGKRAEKNFLLQKIRYHRRHLQDDEELLEEHRNQQEHLNRIAEKSKISKILA